MSVGGWRRYWCRVEARYPSGMWRLVVDGLLDADRGRVFLLTERSMPAWAARGDRVVVETRDRRGVNEVRVDPVARGR